MTREQLTRKNLTRKALRVRNREVLRLFATGLYNSHQIAKEYNRSTRLVNRIRAENLEPVNPWMTINESAEFLVVSPSVIIALIGAGYIDTLAFELNDSPGATISGAPIYHGLRKAWLFKHKNRWGSAKAAARKAGISKKGMEARARNGSVVTLRALRGKSFTLYSQAGLFNIYDLTKISPAASEPTGEQLEIPLAPKRKNSSELGGATGCKIAPIVNTTKEELEQMADQIITDVVLALHSAELIQYEDGVMWMNSHNIEISVGSSPIKAKVVEAEAE